MGINGRTLINSGSPAQLRLRFQEITTTVNASDDYLGFWCGESADENKPTLILQYDRGPAFESETIVKVDATAGFEYMQSIGAKAVDPDDDAKTFSKLSGPAWLTINPSGSLTGIPGEEDVGRNIWLARVDTVDGTDVAYIQIDVFTGDDGEYEEHDKRPSYKRPRD